ncbi:right-handed parallel beta-helix repeat-containing protein [candidate division WOR-3 bacterium]|nr:right-handed parallel beta-helix repeat-containing protein [candidate division WOR-3 bacterium]
MKVITVIAATLLLILPVAAKTVNVGLGAEYTDVQTALDAASSGDVVNVAAGYYSVPDGVEVKKSNVTLKGAGPEQTYLDGEGDAYSVIKIGAEGVTVTGFTLKGGSSHGVYINSSNWGNIHHNVITGNGDRGILLGMGTPHAVIDHNTFANNKVSAIYAYTDDPRTKFTNNVVYKNGRSIVTDSTMSHMTVKYNCFHGQSNDEAAVATSKTNLHDDPMFVDAESDFHLQKGSPCLGKGEKKPNIGALGTGTNPVVEKPASKENGGQYRVVVFTNDEDLGEKILNVIKAAGYADDESYVTDEPDDDANIKYGAAGSDDIKAIRKLVSALYDGKIDLSDEFDSDDNDVFISLP